MDIHKNYFEIFDLPPSFEIDLGELAGRYRRLQREVHPDRCAGGSERDKRLAVQYASYVNEAYETLRSPLQRAEYLLRLCGLDTDQSNATTTDSAFLMRQMELREELSELRRQPDPEAALDVLSGHVNDCLEQLLDAFATCFEAGDYSQAQTLVARLHFMSRLAHEVEQLEAELLDY